MSEMSEHECIMRITEGLRSAADAMKMLGVMQRNSDFLGLSRIVEEISKNCARLATAKSMSSGDLAKGLQKFSAVMGHG